MLEYLVTDTRRSSRRSTYFMLNNICWSHLEQLLELGQKCPIIFVQLFSVSFSRIPPWTLFKFRAWTKISSSELGLWCKRWPGICCINASLMQSAQELMTYKPHCPYVHSHRPQLQPNTIYTWWRCCQRPQVERTTIVMMKLVCWGVEYSL